MITEMSVQQHFEFIYRSGRINNKLYRYPIVLRDPLHQFYYMVVVDEVCNSFLLFRYLWLPRLATLIHSFLSARSSRMRVNIFVRYPVFLWLPLWQPPLHVGDTLSAVAASFRRKTVLTNLGCSVSSRELSNESVDETALLEAQLVQ